MNKEVQERLRFSPRTRFMGSKQKILGFIYDHVRSIKCKRVLDGFNGSCAVSYLFKSMGKEVHTNDFMKYCHAIAKGTIENNKQRISESELKFLLHTNGHRNTLIRDTFKGIYFSNEDNRFLDTTYHNAQNLSNQHKKHLALAALARACVKKRPRGIFTFTGMRYNDGRRDIQIPLKQHFIESINLLNNCIFDNKKKNKSFNKDIFEFPHTDYDLVYFDPPYCSLHSDNDYSRRYHFVEGLMSYWKHVKINEGTKTKKFDKIPSRFDSKEGIATAFNDLFQKFRKSTLVVSYSSNSIPTLQQMRTLMKKYKKNVKVVQLNHKYSFGNQKSNLRNNEVKEYLFIGK